MSVIGEKPKLRCTLPIRYLALLFCPHGSFRSPAPVLIKANDPFVGLVEMVLVRHAYSVLPCCHTLVALDQQRFRRRVHLLSSQTDAQQALGTEPLPTIRLLPSIEIQGLARELLAFSELPLCLVRQCQIGC